MSESSSATWTVIGKIKRADTVAINAAQEAGEPAVAVARINKIRPTSDVLATTRTQVFTGVAPIWGAKATSWVVRIDGRDIFGVSVHKQRVEVRTAAGVVQLGDVFKDDERAMVVEQINAVRERAALEPRHLLTHVSDPTPEPVDGVAGVAAELGSESESAGSGTLELDDEDRARAELLSRFRTDDHWPLAATPILQTLLVHLEYALRHAAAGDVVAEERRLHDLRSLAGKVGMGNVRKVRKLIDLEVEARERAGELRIGSRVLGIVESKRLVSQRLEVRSDRVVLTSGKEIECRPLDADAQAAVTIDGQLFESTRPSLLSAAIASPLPGSSLLFAMAAPKKDKRDDRTALFMVVHPQWRFALEVDPATAPRLRPLAAQLNAVAPTSARGVTGPETSTPGVPTAPVTPATSASSVELEALAAMVEDGLLSEAEALTQRERILRGGDDQPEKRITRYR